MAKKQEKEVYDLEDGPTTFTFNQMPAMRAVDLVTGQIIPAIGKAFAKDGQSAMIGELLCQTSTPEYKLVQKALLETVQVDIQGQRLALNDCFETVFGGNLGLFPKVLTKAFMVNFQSFFPGLADMLPKGLAGVIKTPGE